MQSLKVPMIIVTSLLIISVVFISFVILNKQNSELEYGALKQEPNPDLEEGINIYMKNKLEEKNPNTVYHCANKLYAYNDVHAYALVHCGSFFRTSGKYGKVESTDAFTFPARIIYQNLPYINVLGTEMADEYGPSIDVLFPKELHSVIDSIPTDSQELENIVIKSASKSTPYENFDEMKDRQEAKPAAIQSIKIGPDRKVTFSVLWATWNPKWDTGDNGTYGDFYLYPDKKIAEISFQYGVEIYNCGSGPDGNGTTADVRVDMNEYIAHINRNLLDEDYLPVYNFLMDGTTVKKIYQQCLP